MKTLFKKFVTVVLRWEAKVVLKKYNPTIIAVTGSIGKTSTKDAIFAMVKSKVSTRKSEKSFNGELGVPLTILGLENAWTDIFKWIANMWHGLGLIVYKSDFPKCLVLEIGADHPGEIQDITQWIKPDIAVITMVSKVPVHVEFFDSPEQVLIEKLSLARAVKATGKLVLPAADAAVLDVRKDTTSNASTVPCLTFGIDCAGDVIASDVKIVYSRSIDNSVQSTPIGMSFKLNYQGNSIPAKLMGVIGVQHVKSIITATAVAIAYGMDLRSVVESIADYQAPRGRMNLLTGIQGSIIIDDTYNASPDAVKEALAVLKSVQIGGELEVHNRVIGRKIAILGDMMELGKFSPEEHRNIGVVVAHAADMLVTVGVRALDIMQGAVSAGMAKDMIVSFDNSKEAAEYITTKVATGDVILVKGSQSSRMERVSYALLADPSRAAELLVRQDPEWLAR